MSLDVFQVIADPSRRQMLRLLSAGAMSINTLASNFAMSRPAVSKHLRILSEAGFITVRNSGRERHCSLKPDGFAQLQEWMDFYDDFWSSKLSGLEALINGPGDA